MEIQKQNAVLQTELLKSQLEISKRDLDILNAQKALIEVEHWKRKELAEIEVKKSKWMAKLELFAKQRDLGLMNTNKN